jgi:hypothetical protein
MNGLNVLAGALALAVVAAAPGAPAFGLAETAVATGIATGLAGSSTSAASSTLSGARSSLQGSVTSRDAALKQAMGGRTPPGGRGGGAGTQAIIFSFEPFKIKVENVTKRLGNPGFTLTGIHI